jgi:hypothetical protein
MVTVSMVTMGRIVARLNLNLLVKLRILRLLSKKLWLEKLRESIQEILIEILRVGGGPRAGGVGVGGAGRIKRIQILILMILTIEWLSILTDW